MVSLLLNETLIPVDMIDSPPVAYKVGSLMQFLLHGTDEEGHWQPGLKGNEGGKNIKNWRPTEDRKQRYNFNGCFDFINAQKILYEKTTL